VQNIFQKNAKEVNTLPYTKPPSYMHCIQYISNWLGLEINKAAQMMWERKKWRKYTG